MGKLIMQITRNWYEYNETKYYSYYILWDILAQIAQSCCPFMTLTCKQLGIFFFSKYDFFYFIPEKHDISV